MKYEETVDALNKMISSLERDIEDKKFGTKRPLPPIYWLMADCYRLKGVLELLQKQNEILNVLKEKLKIFGFESHEFDGNTSVEKIEWNIFVPDERDKHRSAMISISEREFDIIKKWLEENK